MKQRDLQIIYRSLIWKYGGDYLSPLAKQQADHIIKFDFHFHQCNLERALDLCKQTFC